MLVKLLKFYQQYKIDDFLNMDVNTIGMLINGMDRVEAMNHLMNMDFVAYPHVDNKSRKANHKKWYKKAYPESFEERVVKTSDLELF